MFRIGFGYDVHRLVKGRDLFIGGIKIPHNKGLLGHSDADVLLHAICDAMLGAIGERDIGFHFPNTDSQYKNISSVILLEKTYSILKNKGWKICNIDSTVVAQQPKLFPYISDMKAKIAYTLGIEIHCVSIKATTSEGLGFAGTGKGICAYAVVMLKKNNNGGKLC